MKLVSGSVSGRVLVVHLRDGASRIASTGGLLFLHSALSFLFSHASQLAAPVLLSWLSCYHHLCHASFLVLPSLSCRSSLLPSSALPLVPWTMHSSSGTCLLTLSLLPSSPRPSWDWVGLSCRSSLSHSLWASCPSPFPFSQPCHASTASRLSFSPWFQLETLNHCLSKIWSEAKQRLAMQRLGAEEWNTFRGWLEMFVADWKSWLIDMGKTHMAIKYGIQITMCFLGGTITRLFCTPRGWSWCKLPYVFWGIPLRGCSAHHAAIFSTPRGWSRLILGRLIWQSNMGYKLPYVFWGIPLRGCSAHHAANFSTLRGWILNIIMPKHIKLNIDCMFW